MTSPKTSSSTPGRPFHRAMRIASPALFLDDAEWIAPKGNATAVALDHTDHMLGAQQSRASSRRMHRMFSRSISPFAVSTPTAMS